jgi:hypothetical protein
VPSSSATKRSDSGAPISGPPSRPCQAETGTGCGGPSSRTESYWTSQSKSGAVEQLPLASFVGCALHPAPGRTTTRLEFGRETEPIQEELRRSRRPSLRVPNKLTTRRRLHTRGADNRCKACGELFPCSASIAAREMSHQVVPTATVRARDFEHQLRSIHEGLKAFERELRNRPDQDTHERTRPDMIALAIEHLQTALDALEMAGRD